MGLVVGATFVVVMPGMTTRVVDIARGIALAQLETREARRVRTPLDSGSNCAVNPEKLAGASSFSDQILSHTGRTA